MKNIYRVISLICVMNILSVQVFAQNVSNITATQVGKTIHINYDLDKTADITLHLSMDGGRNYQQLYSVSGDAGKNITAGHKTIVWDVLSERENLRGDNIVFQVKAQGNVKRAFKVNVKRAFKVNGVTFKMIKIKGGTFTRGATSEQGTDAESDEKPVHSVTLSDFWIGETEVTQGLWVAVMGSNPASFKKGDNFPVENVSWNSIQDFLRKLNQITGKNFTLPTEAQWEYAARGGGKSRGYKYAGSNILESVAWYNDNSDYKTHLVKTKRPNELGLYDMSGNVWEWCSDWYGDYSVYPQTNPTGIYSGSYRVIRGGGFRSIDRNCRVSYRGGNDPDSIHSYDYIGFRLVLVK